MKVIVAGSRNFHNFELLRQVLDSLGWEITEIVSGGAKGADKLGELYARLCKIDLQIFTADWDEYDKAAGPIRNEQMAKYADAAVIFWDGKSRGTENMIEMAKKYELTYKVVKYETNI